MIFGQAFPKRLKMNKFLLILFLLIIFGPAFSKSGIAITGTVGDFTADGQITTISFNATGPLEVRGLGDYISAQFKDFLNHITFRGRFSQLKAENSAPAAPVLDSPANNTYQNTTSVAFSWTNSTEADNDTVSYRIEIYNDSSLTQDHTINSSIVETNTPTKATITLVDNQTYYWHVLANDSSENSTFSVNRSITIDQIIPLNFNLTTPTNDTSTTDNSLQLAWDTATDTNLDNYSIELSTTSSFASIAQTQTSTTNSFSNWSNPLDSGTYYWRVTAIDKANNQKPSDNNLTFTIEALTTTTEISSGTGTGSGGVAPRFYSFHIIAPPSITIFVGESIVVPLTIQNIGNNINLNQIRLSAESDTPGITATLDRDLINTLPPGSNSTINLIVNAASTLQGAFSVSVFAEIDTPRLSDSVRIITNIIGEEGINKESTQQQLIFARQFFDGNSQCSDLQELLTQADQEIQQGNYAKALNSLTNAINSCKDLIAVKTSKAPSLLDITMNVVRENRSTAIVSSEVIGFFIILIFIFRRFIRRKPKQIKLDF